MIAEIQCGARLPKDLVKKLDRDRRKRKMRGRGTVIREIVTAHYAAQDAAPKP